MIQELIDGPERRAARGSTIGALPFQVEALDVRGRVVRLGASLDAILAAPRLSGARVAAARRGGGARRAARHLAEVDGRFILQTRTDGPVDMMVVDFRTPGPMRATARASTGPHRRCGGRRPRRCRRLLGRGISR